MAEDGIIAGRIAKLLEAWKPDLVNVGDIAGAVAAMPDLRTGLMQNVTGDAEEAARSDRLRSAWKASDELHRSEARGDGSKQIQTPSEAILADVTALSFERRHLSNWQVASGTRDHGTALLVSGINYDLLVEMEEVCVCTRVCVCA